MTDTVQALGKRLQDMADRECGGPKTERHFLDEKPERWWAEPRWRCVNNHVSTNLLGTETGHVCRACFEPVWLTFPEDVDGPLDATIPLWEDAVKQALED